MADTRIAQPANVLFQIGLTGFQHARGIKAAAIVGHSVWEIGSGFAAGLLSLKKAPATSPITAAISRRRLEGRASTGTVTELTVVSCSCRKPVRFLQKSSGYSVKSYTMTREVPLYGLTCFAKHSGVRPTPIPGRHCAPTRCPNRRGRCALRNSPYSW